MKNELITFKDGTLELNVPVSWEQETVWLTRNQKAEFFERYINTIGKHIFNALIDELDNSSVANFATVQMEGGREVKRNIEHYNLDMIISVGYRVKSKRCIQFRIWANKILKDYQKNPSKYKERPNMPGYLRNSQYVAWFSNQTAKYSVEKDGRAYLRFT